MLQSSAVSRCRRMRLAPCMCFECIAREWRSPIHHIASPISPQPPIFPNPNTASKEAKNELKVMGAKWGTCCPIGYSGWVTHRHAPKTLPNKRPTTRITPLIRNCASLPRFACCSCVLLVLATFFPFLLLPFVFSSNLFVVFDFLLICWLSFQTFSPSFSSPFALSLHAVGLPDREG